MDYEKEYNDLIARINAVKNTPKIGMKDKHHYNGYVESGIRDALDYILSPDSEDERILEAMICRFGDLSEMWFENIFCRQFTKAQILSYLEKQKDAIGAARQQGYEEGMEAGASMVESMQKEQKPVEWSEIDKLKLQTIKEVIAQQNGSAAFGGFLKSELIDFLKSLRPQPHWKPSEEQMEALNAINCYGALSYVCQQEHLISLYNDIKKL